MLFISQKSNMVKFPLHTRKNKYFAAEILFCQVPSKFAQKRQLIPVMGGISNPQLYHPFRVFVPPNRPPIPVFLQKVIPPPILKNYVYL